MSQQRSVAFIAIRKAQAACMQSFAPWQQATIEFTRRDRSIIACLHHIYCCSSRTSRFCGESRIQHNATREVATASVPLVVGCTTSMGI